MDLASMAKLRMEERGLKISWVAKKVGVKPDTLGRFLNGKMRLGRSAQLLLAHILDITEQAS